jgi:hypothetical protein
MTRLAMVGMVGLSAGRDHLEPQQGQEEGDLLDCLVIHRLAPRALPHGMAWRIATPCPALASARGVFALVITTAWDR